MYFIMEPCKLNGLRRLKTVSVFVFLCLATATSATDEGTEWIRSHIHSPDASGEREPRAPERVMYLNQGVEFVFPLGVHYTLANVNEQQSYPVPTTGFEAVLEFPRNKMAIMFSSMVNTLRLANFSVHSTIYTNDSNVHTTPALRILGTDVSVLGSKDLIAQGNTAQINKDVAVQTDGIITDLIPKAAYYGSAVYPFTKAILANTIKYENYWAWPWRDGGFDRFSDSPLMPYMEVEGLMPYYENEAFAAVAALFKGGTGSVVFLKPKGNVTILQLMLQPTALTEIFDENFPGWGVKTMKVKVPVATFTTTTRHAETLQKRGVVDTFCSADVRENLFGVLRVASSFFLNPIVQTNHVQIAKDVFRIASATGVTVNSQSDYDTIPRNGPLYDEVPSDEADVEVVEEQADISSTASPPVSVEIATNPPAIEEVSSTSAAPVVAEEEEVASTGRSARSVDEVVEDAAGSTDKDEEVAVTIAPEIVADPAAEVEESEELAENDDPAKVSSAEAAGKEGKRGVVKLESYIFDEPFLWFLHATNEEPMFMGIIESFKRYKEQGANKVINVANTKFAKNGGGNTGSAKLPIVDTIADTANINLWNC